MFFKSLWPHQTIERSLPVDAPQRDARLVSRPRKLSGRGRRLARPNHVTVVPVVSRLGVVGQPDYGLVGDRRPARRRIGAVSLVIVRGQLAAVVVGRESPRPLDLDDVLHHVTVVGAGFLLRGACQGRDRPSPRCARTNI